MSIHWAALFEVLVVSLAVAVGVVVLFSLAVLAIAPAAAADAIDAGGAVGAADVPPRATPAARAVAGVCLAVCAAIVLLGIYLIVNR